MSDETKAVLENALAAHLADEMPDHILTAWWVMMSGSDMERPDRTGYWYDGPSNQPFHVTVGLDRMSTIFIDRENSAGS